MRKRFNHPSSILSIEQLNLSFFGILGCTDCRNNSCSVFKINHYLRQVHFTLLGSEELMSVAIQNLSILWQGLKKLNSTNGFIVIRHMLHIKCIFNDLFCLMVHFSLCKNNHSSRVIRVSFVNVEFLNLIDQFPVLRSLVQMSKLIESIHHRFNYPCVFLRSYRFIVNRGHKIKIYS